MTAGSITIDDNVRRAFQRWCPQCSYDLRGSPTARCSECGFEPPAGFFAFAARRVDVITAIHLIASPIAFVFWLLGAPVFFALVGDTHSDSVLVLISIGYILLIIPIFIIVVRVLRRIIPLQPAFTSVFYAGPHGFGIRKLKSPHFRMHHWSRFHRTRTKAISKQRVRIRILHLIWPIHLQFDLQLDPDQAGTLAQVCGHWASNTGKAPKRHYD